MVVRWLFLGVARPRDRVGFVLCCSSTLLVGSDEFSESIWCIITVGPAVAGAKTVHRGAFQLVTVHPGFSLPSLHPLCGGGLNLESLLWSVLTRDACTW